MEANQNMQNYHRLFLVSQERYDRLSNLAGSGGACGFKDTSVSDSTSTDSQFSPSIASAEDGKIICFYLHIGKQQSKTLLTMDE